MFAQLTTVPRWATSSLSDAVDSSPAELSALGAHVDRCNGCRSRWFALQCGFDALHDLLEGRIVTVLLLLGAVVGASAVVF